jgi:hypothetical protein
VPSRSTVSGQVIASDGTSVTVQVAGRRAGTINRLLAAASQLNRADYSYVWGGGHAAAGVASVGARGPGYTGHTAGYDCSGAVAAVLSGAGLWTPGRSVPNDAGVIDQLLQEGIIVPGVGTGPVQVTLYDRPGIHIFMNIDGRFFGTSDGNGDNAAQRNGGAGWLDDGAPDATNSRFRRYHIVPRLLHVPGGVAYAVTALLGQQSAGVIDLAAGDHVRLSFIATGTGADKALAVTLRGASTLTGTVVALAASGGSVTLGEPGGQNVVLGTLRHSILLRSLQVGDGIAATVVRQGNGLIARGMTVVSTPSPPTTTSTPTTTTTTTTTTSDAPTNPPA